MCLHGATCVSLRKVEGVWPLSLVIVPSLSTASMTSPRATKDVFFELALAALPATLLGAMQAAEATDPAVLRLYPRYTSLEVELMVVTQSLTVSLTVSPRKGDVEAASAGWAASAAVFWCGPQGSQEHELVGRPLCEEVCGF